MIPVEMGNLTTWSIIELGLGIIAASCATLRPIFRLVLRWFHSSATQNDAKASQLSTTFHSKEEKTPRLVSVAIPEPARVIDKEVGTFRPSSISNQPAAFFFDSDSPEEDQITPASSPSELQTEIAPKHRSIGDLESNWRSSRMNRGTWWPLPRTSILIEEEGEELDALYYPGKKS
jgi:hypothetical protein